MSDIVGSLLNRFSREAYDLPAVFVELLLIGLCVNWAAGVLQGTRGTRPLRGVLIILVVTTLVVRILSVQFEWVRLELLYRYVLYALAFIGLVVFQPELRRAVIRIGDVRLRRNRAPESQVITALVKSAGFLSRNKYGALIAIQRSVDLTGWAENGTVVRAEATANLLNTIFYPGTALHDLGVIIRGSKIVAANCQFPSAESDEVDIALGSRHLAAVGMSYETDALVLVVSEETGVVSIADGGKLTRYLSLDDLALELTSRLASRSPDEPARAPRGGWWRRLRRALVVIPLTAIIWYVADQATLKQDNVTVLLEVRQDDPTREVEPVGATAFTALVRGPGRAIDRLRSGAEPLVLHIPWTVSKTYSPQPDAYSLDADELYGIVARSRELTERALTVVRLAVTNLSFHVYERVALTLPVRVPTDAGGVRLVVESVQPPTAEIRVRRADQKKIEAQGFILAAIGAQVEGVPPGEVRQLSAVPLKEPTGLTGPAQITPRAVKATVRVTPQRQLIKNVVVRLFVSPEVAERLEVRKTDLNEWRVDVNVQGDEAVFETGDSLDLQAFVHVNADVLPPPGAPLTEQTRTLDVQFLTPKGVSVTERRSVHVTLVPRVAGGP